MFPPRLSPLFLTGFALLVHAANPASTLATNIYVDNRVGSDGTNGQSLRPLDRITGPVRTIRRGLQLCNGGDTLVIINTGRPYYESLQLFGGAHSGEPGADFEIIGNGAVVSGLRTLPPESWKYLGEHLWELHTHRKGTVLLLVDGVPIPRSTSPDPTATKIPLGHYDIVRGRVHYQGDARHRPPTMNFAFGFSDVGVTLYKVNDVTIRDLTFQHFRLDGVAAPDSARRITLENVTTVGNGRAGVSLGGLSTIVLRGGAIRENREHSVLVRDNSAIEVEGTDWDVEPTVE